ncbi:hypothetical protein EmuJ_001017000 [Echinococcus multilocularis]|uniref:Uncharacterized protein n=1 Tax=Echinococcus multilocularis TaxID=6211 RepID=A0A068YJM5_ECHMU|nr:hypothetical protein EmuJ_001017000 [Echinococcus multilocularis]
MDIYSPSSCYTDISIANGFSERDAHSHTCGDYFLQPTSLDSGLKGSDLKYCAIPCKASRCKRPHPIGFENPSWASLLNRGVRFDDKGRIVAIDDVIRPRQRMNDAIKVAWNIQTNKLRMKYS